MQVDTCASLCLHSKAPANAHEGSSDVKIRQLSNKAADSVKFRAMVGASACAVASALVLAGGVTSAQAETRCTWGGTPANPTGTIAFDPGLTVIAAPFALKFKAVGLVEAGGPRASAKLRSHDSSPLRGRDGVLGGEAVCGE